VDAIIPLTKPDGMEKVRRARQTKARRHPDNWTLDQRSVIAIYPMGPRGPLLGTFAARAVEDGSICAQRLCEACACLVLPLP
jgi:hypothetical protein